MALTVNQAVTHFPEAARRAWMGMWRDDVALYAAGIAFHSLAGIFASLFLFSTLLENLGADPDFLVRLTSSLEGALPPEAIQFLASAVEIAHQPVPAALLPLALIMTVWVSSNVFQAVIHALNRIYHLEDRRAPWITRLLALAVVLVVGLCLMAAFLLLAFGEVVGGWSPEWQEARSGFLQFMIDASKPLSALPVLFGMLVLYYLAPNFKFGHRIVMPGAVVFTVSWLATSYGFNLYLQKVAVYDRVYGPLATAVVFLTWVYLSALLLLVGGEVNASYSRILMRESGTVNSTAPEAV